MIAYLLLVAAAVPTAPQGPAINIFDDRYAEKTKLSYHRYLECYAGRTWKAKRSAADIAAIIASAKAKCSSRYERFVKLVVRDEVAAGEDAATAAGRARSFLDEADGRAAEALERIRSGKINAEN